MNQPTSLRNAFFLLILFSALVNLIVGGLVLTDSPRRKINRLFTLLCFTLTAWGFSFIGLNLATNSDVSLFWFRLYAACLLIVPPLFYHLVLGSIGNPLKGVGSVIPEFFEKARQLAYVFGIGWFALMLKGVFPYELARGALFLYPDIGEQFWVAALVYTVLTGIGLFLLARHANLAQDPSQKNRLVYLLIVGASSAIVGMMFTAFLTHSATFASGWVVTGSHLLSTVCLMLIAYALTTNQIYQFAELFRKIIALLSMTLILLFVFGATHILARQLLVPYIPRSDFFALGMASIIMSLLFHPLRFRVQNIVDRIFFTQRYDQMQRLRGLSRRVLSSADRDELLNVLYSSLKGIGFNSVCLLLKDPLKPAFYIKKAMGLESQSEGLFLRSDSLLIQYVREEKKELIRDEVTRRVLTDWERQSLTDEMDLLQAEVSFPLFSTRRRALFGVLTLGNSKLGYSSYLGRNIFWLKSVIENAGIMLDNFYHHEFANALIPYVGRTWAEEMRRNKEGFRERLSGHRTWVAILMVDIRHFTNMSTRLDPQEVVSLLKDFRLRVAPMVYRYQGTIDKFIGDAVMIVFGLPILPHLANPDLNAVECAAAIMQEISLLSKSRVEAGKEGISIGIGVSSGEVIAGNVDSGDRLEYTVIGDAPNMVARLEDLAGDNQILMSPATYGKVQNHVDVNAWEPRHLTGFNEPVSIFELNKVLPAEQPNELNPLSQAANE